MLAAPHSAPLPQVGTAEDSRQPPQQDLPRVGGQTGAADAVASVGIGGAGAGHDGSRACGEAVVADDSAAVLNEVNNILADMNLDTSQDSGILSARSDNDILKDLGLDGLADDNDDDA